jgi:hypothetical protein
VKSQSDGRRILVLRGCSCIKAVNSLGHLINYKDASSTLEKSKQLDNRGLAAELISFLFDMILQTTHSSSYLQLTGIKRS